MELDYSLFAKLTQLNGVSGYESEVRKFIEPLAAPLCDEMYVDAIGDLICLKKGNGEHKKRIMYAAHMDEIGLQVIKVNEDGTLMVKELGCVWIYTAYQGRCVFRNGTMGVIESRCRPDKIDGKKTNLYVDIGVSSKEEALMYVKVGDVACFYGPYHDLAGDYSVAKAVDNRVGCFMLLETMEQYQDKVPYNDMYFVFTVQEEEGCRGGIVTAERINPDLGVAVDVTPDNGRPGDLEGNNVCGNGAAVKITDTSVICDEYLVNKMFEICEQKQIRYQRDVIYVGGTDASAVNLARYGIKAAGVSVCTRYTHGQNCIFRRDDVLQCVRLLTAFANTEFEFESFQKLK